MIKRRYTGRRTRFVYLAITEPWPKVSGIVKVDLDRHSQRQSQRQSHADDHNEENSSQSHDDHHEEEESEESEPCVVAKFMFGDGCFGGEPMFVPRDEDGDLHSSDEDDGYLLTFVHDENCDRSRLIVLDAKSPSLALVASVDLPSRVPFGFHGTFITSKELHKHWSCCS
jgi:9-cis-epoxycarotenoid dioxygenase